MALFTTSGCAVVNAYALSYWRMEMSTRIEHLDPLIFPELDQEVDTSSEFCCPSLQSSPPPLSVRYRDNWTPLPNQVSASSRVGVCACIALLHENRLLASIFEECVLH